MLVPCSALAHTPYTVLIVFVLCFVFSAGKIRKPEWRRNPKALAHAEAMAAEFVNFLLHAALCDGVKKRNQDTVMEAQVMTALHAVRWPLLCETLEDVEECLPMTWMKRGLGSPTRVRVNPKARAMLLEKVWRYMTLVFKHVSPPEEPITLTPPQILRHLLLAEVHENLPDAGAHAQDMETGSDSE